MASRGRRAGRGLPPLGPALLGHRLLDGTSRQQVVVPKAPPVSRASLADVPSIHDVADRAVAGLDQYTVSVGLEPQATHLKHNATAVASVFLDRLPSGMKPAANP